MALIEWMRFENKGPELSRSALYYSHRALVVACLCRGPQGSGTERWPGQPGSLPTPGLSWGQDSPESNVVVGVGRVVVVALGTARGLVAGEDAVKLHRQHPMPAQKAVHLGFRLADVLDRDDKQFQLHRGSTPFRRLSKNKFDRCAAFSFPFRKFNFHSPLRGPHWSIFASSLAPIRPVLGHYANRSVAH